MASELNNRFMKFAEAYTLEVTIIVGLLISLIMPQLVLPPLLSILSNWLDSLPGLNAANFIIFLNILLNAITFAIANIYLLKSFEIKWYVIYIAFAISLAFLLILMPIFSFFFLKIYSPSLFEGESLATIILNFATYPALSVAVTDNAAGFWALSTLGLGALYYIYLKIIIGGK